VDEPFRAEYPGEIVVSPINCSTLAHTRILQHFIADPEDYANDAFFTSAAWNTVQLSLIDEDVFPFPYVGYGSSRFEADALPPNTSFLVPNLQVKMHPAGQAEVVANHEKDRSMPNNPQAIEAARTEVFESDNMEPYVKACLEARDAVSRDPRSQTPRRFAGDDIVVTTLGTGSALPSKYRNVSATYLDIPDSGGILLDCGEGTLGQLRRRFGPDGMRDIYRDLKMIFISHMHADHHLGLHAILEDRFRVSHTVADKRGKTNPSSARGDLPAVYSRAQPRGNGPTGDGHLAEARIGRGARECPVHQCV
jgi:ribonuclease Z